jgi:hypothetical protein
MPAEMYIVELTIRCVGRDFNSALLHITRCTNRDLLTTRQPLSADLRSNTDIVRVSELNAGAS